MSRSLISHPALIAFFLVGSLASAQVKPFDPNKPASEQIVRPALVPRGQTVALEGPIDPDAYRLGPGDELSFQVWSALEFSQMLTVNPDGFLSIPTVGDVYVAGFSLTEADSIVRSAADRAYPRARTSLRLTKVRSLKASISGAVEIPGSYELTAIDRLSTLIASAGGFIEPSAETEAEILEKTRARTKRELEMAEEKREVGQDQLPSKRHILITYKDGTTVTVDYLRFERTGDAGSNPLITDGAQVFVPFVDAKVGVLNIFGAVKSPGEYEFRAGDRLSDLVALAGGFRADAALNEITIVRFMDGGRERRAITVDFGSDGGQFPLREDDRVFVRAIPEFRPKYAVKVTGEVLYPGEYPVEDDSTTLKELIARCGGFTDRADLGGAKVIRQSMALMDDPEYERLLQMNVAEMTDMEYEYFKTRSRIEAPAVVVDFKRLFDDNPERDIRLKDGDEIVIPTLSPTVNVIGQVNSPGLVGYVVRRNYEYYIRQAGGFAWNARKAKVRLIKARTGRWMKPNAKTPIEVGDTIFIPEKKDIDYWELWKDLLLIASQIATILLVLRSVR